MTDPITDDDRDVLTDASRAMLVALVEKGLDLDEATDILRMAVDVAADLIAGDAVDTRPARLVVAGENGKGYDGAAPRDCPMGHTGWRDGCAFCEAQKIADAYAAPMVAEKIAADPDARALLARDEAEASRTRVLAPGVRDLDEPLPVPSIETLVAMGALTADEGLLLGRIRRESRAGGAG